MEIVDAHHHLWDRGRFRYGWLHRIPAIDREYLLGDYEDAIAMTGVGRSVHVQADADEEFAIQETRWVLSMADAGGPVEGVVGWAPVERPDLGSFLDRLGPHPRLKGFRRLLQGEADAGFGARPDFVEGVKLLGQRGYSFDICIYHHQLPGVLELARRAGGTPLVLDHAGKPAIREGRLEPWRRHLRELATIDHVCCKLSGMVTEADWKRWSIADLRPYAGSDWPVSTLAVDYAGWLEAVEELVSGASQSERQSLFRDTAARFYRLG